MERPPAADSRQPLEAAWEAGDGQRLEALATAALAEAPGDVEALAWLGLGRWARGAAGPAREALRAALQAARPRPGGSLPPALAAALDRLVAHPTRGGAEAARLVVEGLGLEHPPSLRRLAAEAAGAGGLDAAVALLRRVLATAPDDAEAHYFLARLLARLGKRPNALKHLRAALAPGGDAGRAVRRRARTEGDFHPLRGDADFQDALGTLPVEEVLRPLYAALDRRELERAAGLAPGLLGIARNPLDVLLPWREALLALVEQPGGEGHAAVLAEVEARLEPYLARGEESAVYRSFHGE